jgi:hypothetical protein
MGSDPKYITMIHEGLDPKYITMIHEGLEVMLIFSPSLVHKDVADALLKHRPGTKILSAGFVQVSQIDNEDTCYGESVSLNLQSRPVDSKLATEMLRAQS